MPKVEFIRHKCKRILLIDLSNSDYAEQLSVIEEARIIISKQPEHSLLSLVDVTNSKFNIQIAGALKNLALQDKPYIKHAAVTGVTGLRKVIYNAVMQFSGRKIPMFDTLEHAKDWLAEQEGLNISEHGSKDNTQQQTKTDG